MNPARKTPLLLGTMALLGMAGVVVLSNGNGDSVLAEKNSTADSETPIDGAEKPEPQPPGLKGDFVPPQKRSQPKPKIPAGATEGIISVRIAVSTRVLDRLGPYTLEVWEDVNPNARKETDPKPFYKKIPGRADLRKGTPYVDIEGIPFSSHAYRVKVSALGINGSSGLTYVTAETPLGSRQVELALTPGAIYSVRLLDQRRNARRDLEVRMIPIGERVAGRRMAAQKTNASGSAIFENVLEGDYNIVVGHVNAPMAPPVEVTVYPAIGPASRDGRLKTQGRTITIPDGHNVTVDVMSRWGYYIEGAEVRALQLEVSRHHEFKGTTDSAGRLVLENVPFGIYQLSIATKRNGRKDLKFTVKKDGDPPLVPVKMHR